MTSVLCRIYLWPNTITPAFGNVINYSDSQRNAKENMLNGSGNLLPYDMEKAKALIAFFGSVFPEKVSEDPYTISRVFGRECDITNRKGRQRQGVRSSLDIHKSMRPDGIGPKGTEGDGQCHCKGTLSSLRGHGDRGGS